MKRKYLTIVLVVLAIASITAATVYAKTFKNITVERQTSLGYTADDAYSMLAIISNSNEKDINVIKEKYKELGSWEAVADSYKISKRNFEDSKRAMLEADQLELPDDIYKEMRESGMTDDECQSIMLRAHANKYDIKVVWDAMKNGKTLRDLINERAELENKKSQAATDLTFGSITQEEYIEKMQKLSPEMKMSEILEFAAKERKEWRQMRIAGSGISEEEIKLAQKAGMKDIFRVCQLKDASKFSSKSFAEMVELIGKGEDFDTVINDSIDNEKIRKAQEEARKEAKE